MKLFGINPKIEATRKYIYGIPTSGEPRFTNQFGIRGVSLRNIMYQNKLFSLDFTILLNLLNKSGNFLKTKSFANV
jgi:hypothetical protein